MDKLTLTFTAATGAFSGTFINPVTSVKTAFSGVVLQNTQTGAGFFLGSSDSGTVEVAPQPRVVLPFEGGGWAEGSQASGELASALSA